MPVELAHTNVMRAGMDEAWVILAPTVLPVAAHSRDRCVDVGAQNLRETRDLHRGTGVAG